MKNFYSLSQKIFFFVFLIFATIGCSKTYGQILWTAPPVNSAWLTNTNWQFITVPNATDWVKFDVNTPGAGGVGINMGDPTTNNGANNQAVGAIEVTAARITTLLIGNSSTGSNGTLTLNGTTVNGIVNVILRNASPNLFTIDNTQALGNKTLTVALNNPIDNIINIDGTGGITINTVISGFGRNLTLSGNGTGTLFLIAANAYTGLTTILANILQLNNAGGGTLPATNSVDINAGGTLQISSNQTLQNLTLRAGANLILDPGVVLTINGTFFYDGGTINGTGIITYGPGGALQYDAITPQTTSIKEFPTVGSPNNVVINNPAGVSLDAPRVIAGILVINNNGNFILGNNDFTAFITGGTATNASHVVTNGTGKLVLTNIGAANKLFPIGATTTSITPLIIFNGNNVDYGARVELGFPFPIFIPANAVNRTWTVQASSTPGAAVNVNFFYAFGDGNAGFDYLATVDHGVYISGAWNINIPNLAQAGAYEVATTVTSFLGGTDLPMVIGNLGSILAINRSIDLSAQKQNGKGLLSWTVNTSTPVKETVIQRSVDGKNFISLSTVGPNTKSYTDNNLLTGTNYYRIKITDINGKMIYSSKVAILNKENGFDIISLMPNIVNTDMVLNVTSAQKTKMNIVIADVTGKALTKNVYNLIAGSNQFDINVATLSTGIYFVTATTANGDAKTMRFVKQ